MKHFFDQNAVLTDEVMSELLRTAKQELKQKPMNLSEMSSKVDLICFNSSASEQYIPRGMDSLVTTKNLPLNQKISKHFRKNLDDLIAGTPGDVFGYLLGNIQIKEIYNYLDILFSVPNDFLFKPQVVTHFSYTELIDYLTDFLKGGVIDGTRRKIDVFDEKSPKPWKTLSKASEMGIVEKAVRAPVILDRPFFTDIHIYLSKQGQQKTVESSVGKLKSLLGYFNRQRGQAGEIIRSKNKMFLQIKDIKSFKLSSTQAKNLSGISYKGEYVAAAQFVSHEIGLKHLNMADVDFFSIKIDRKPVDLKPEQITNIEFNLDTQQLVISRGIGDDEFHIARFNRLKLYKDDQTAFIHKAIPFNRGQSNFDQIQTFFATRYTEFEKAKQILTARGELGLLSSRNVVAGDLTAHMALSSMKLLGLLPFEAKCLGFSPEDIRNPDTTATLFQKEFEELQKLFREILDVSDSPTFTEHNFNRLSKQMRGFIALKKPSDIEGATFEKLIGELEKLTEYMDNFFKLDVYNELKENLDVEKVVDLEEQAEEDGMMLDTESERLDDKTKEFISENYAFFQKRDLVQKALLKIEKLMFYNDNIKPFVDDRSFEADLVAYSTKESQANNYFYASYPAIALSKVLDPAILKHESEVDELLFVKFMRDFTQRTYQKSLELNKSFHHQYKHTLAELGFVVDEKLRQLNEELTFLETPENREQAYKQLLEKITKMFHDHLREKEKNIGQLKIERKEIQKKQATYRKELEKQLEVTIEENELESLLRNMPDRLEKMKQDIVSQHKKRLNEISPVFNSYVKLHASASTYFEKVLSYSSLFQKALWMHRYQKMTDDVKKQAEELYGYDPQQLDTYISDLEQDKPDPTKVQTLKKEISGLTEDLKDALYELRKIPSKDLYKSPKTDKERLREYLEYYRDETYRLTRLAGMLQSVYQQMNQLQNALFKKQEELVLEELKSARHEFMLQVANIVKTEQEPRQKVKELETNKENIPKEIKDELGKLRSVLISALNEFKEHVTRETLKQISDYKRFLFDAQKRDKVNDLTKELVNFGQGIKATLNEIEGEKKDLEYLKSQEENLEKIAMSKALPSTRVLLKTQYIPLVEREKALLNRANAFLAEIISKEKQVRDGLTNTFFRKRYGYAQFTRGSYAMDTGRGAKDHTEKNTYAAHILFAERHKSACAPVAGKVEKLAVRKIEIQGMEGLKNRISQTWHGNVDDRFIFLPASLSLEEVLELCDYKETICKGNPKPKKSKNSIILIYVQKLKYDQLQQRPDLLRSYNEAILSNIFINIDDSKVFNNRDSIYEALVKETFGSCNDDLSKQIFEGFFKA